VVFCYFLSQFLVLFVLRLFSIEIAENDTVALTVLGITIYVLMLALTVSGPCLVKKRFSLKYLTGLFGLSRRPKWSDLGLAIMSFLCYFGVLLVAMLLLAWFLPDVYNQTQDLGYATENNETWQLILVFARLVIITPIAEELIMRGLLFKKIRNKLSFWPTAIIVSLIFAVSHGQFNVGVDTFLLSLFLCYQREKTGAIYTPIIIHMLKNLVGFLGVFILI
jgi:membrane protease YdiL (CAAX protease family)